MLSVSVLSHAKFNFILPALDGGKIGVLISDKTLVGKNLVWVFFGLFNTVSAFTSILTDILAYVHVPIFGKKVFCPCRHEPVVEFLLASSLHVVQGGNCQ